MPTARLLPGAYADVHFKVAPGVLGASLQLPANVLLFRSDGIHVATVNPNGEVTLKTIIIGRDYGSAIEVVNGLTPQDVVILSPSGLAAGSCPRAPGRTGGRHRFRAQVRSRS